MQLLIRARVTGDKEFTIIPSKIKFLLQKNSPEHTFDFVIGELEDDPIKMKNIKYKNQKKMSTKNLKGEKFILPLKSKEVIIKVDNDGHIEFSEKNSNETILPSFTNFLNESNIKYINLFDCSVKIYCLGSDLKIECENVDDVVKINKKLKEEYDSVHFNLDDQTIEINLLPSEILKLFRKRYE